MFQGSFYVHGRLGGLGVVLNDDFRDSKIAAAKAADFSQPKRRSLFFETKGVIAGFVRLMKIPFIIHFFEAFSYIRCLLLPLVTIPPHPAFILKLLISTYSMAVKLFTAYTQIQC